MGAVNYDGYVAQIDFDATIGALVGRVVNSREPIEFYADAASDVLAEFRAAIEAFRAECEAEGTEPTKPYSGKLLLRIDPELHADVAAEAARRAVSINGFVEATLVQAVAAR